MKFTLKVTGGGRFYSVYDYVSCYEVNRVTNRSELSNSKCIMFGIKEEW